MVVDNIIENDIYIKLMNYAFQKTDAVMFVSRKDGFTKEEMEVIGFS